MSYEDICTTLAQHYSGFTAEVVASMTPAQTQVYINALAKQLNPQDGQAGQPLKPLTDAECVEESKRYGLPEIKNY